jgi:hypothetical protein
MSTSVSPKYTSTNPTNNIPDSADVVVVGAGMAGLYCAYKILEQDPAKSVVVVDRLNRTGGRLDSDLIRIIGEDGQPSLVREEEGGMRFTEDMTELYALFDELGLRSQIVPFPMGPPVGKPNLENYYFRGRHFSKQYASDNPSIWSELYTLEPAEQNKQPGTILTDLYKRLLKHNAQLVENKYGAHDANVLINQKPFKEVTALQTPEYWQFMRLNFVWEGTPLYKWTAWGLFSQMGLSDECIAMLTHTLGFEGPIISLMNAGEAFQLLEDFPATPEFHTFRFGFSTLPNALVGRIENQAGQIYVGTNVDCITRVGNGDYQLSLTVVPEGSYDSATPHGPGTSHLISAPKVILAVARNAMEILSIMTVKVI